MSENSIIDQALTAPVIPLMDREAIMAIIPHRDPFLLVDEVLEMTEESIVAQKKITGDEFFFKGHFPGMPIMPGVLIVEAIAQAGAIVALSKEENKGKIAVFAGIDKVRIRKSVFPGDTIRLEVKLTKKRGPIGFGEGKAFVDGKLCVGGEIMFAIVDRENQEPAAKDTAASAQKA